MRHFRHLSFRPARLGPLHALLGAALLLIAAPGHSAPPGADAPPTAADAPTTTADAPTEADDAATARFNSALDAWDLDTAAAEVDAMPAGSVRDVKAGILALFRAQYPAAEALLSGALTSGQLPTASAITQEAQPKRWT